MLRIHDRLIKLDGGAEGLRDSTLLKSALARPKQLHVYSEGSDIIDLAAAYTVGILRNHPFFDGNKRTGFVVGVLFLELNGYLFSATEDAATEAVLELAAGTINEGTYSAFLREHAAPV